MVMRGTNGLYVLLGLLVQLAIDLIPSSATIDGSSSINTEGINVAPCMWTIQIQQSLLFFLTCCMNCSSIKFQVVLVRLRESCEADEVRLGVMYMYVMYVACMCAQPVCISVLP